MPFLTLVGSFSSKLGDLLIEWLRAIGGFIGQSIQLILGIAGVILVTCLGLSGEIIDDVTTYKADAIPWPHIAKVVIPPTALAVAAYIKHRQTVDKAVSTQRGKDEYKAKKLMNDQLDEMDD